MAYQELPSGKQRYTIIISTDYHERLAQVAKTHKISQGEVVEVLLDFADKPEIAAVLTAKRERKVDTRSDRKDLLKKLRSLSPEQLALLEKM